MKIIKKVLIAVVCVTIVAASFCTGLAAENESSCEHEYTVSLKKAPTDSEDGIRVLTCTKCGETIEEAIPATGHKWSEWKVTKEPTCADSGQRTRVCTKHTESPHYEYETIPPTGIHDYVETREDATCEEDGLVTYKCSICGDSYTEVIPSTGHLWGDWVTDKEATNVEAGHMYRVCLNDSTHMEERIIPTLVYEEQEAPANGVNTMDYVLSGIFALAVASLGIPLVSGYRIIGWYNKKKKQFAAEQEALRKG